MEDDGKLNKENARVPHYHQEKSQTFFAIKPDKEDKEENVYLKNLTESSEDIKEDQYIDIHFPFLLNPNTLFLILNSV